MISFPNAKINLGLNIIEKRPDGYHNLESCFHPVGWCDILEINKSDQLIFKSSGIDIPGGSSSNLCLKAFETLKSDFDIAPVSIHLHKVIPIGAGLGGGSSDGAFALKMLNELFDLKLSIVQLENYAGQLGSDCPFFIQNKPKYVAGTGDFFENINLNLLGKHITIIKPDIHISTAEAYSGITPRAAINNCKKVLEGQSIDKWEELLVNDFEESIFPNHPEIKFLKESLYKAGAEYACMTGSGAAVFAISDNPIELQSTAGQIIWRGIL